MNEALKSLVRKLTELEREISAEKGDFSVFGLFHPEGSPYNSWDLVFSAPWLGEGLLEDYRFMNDRLQPRLNDEERYLLSSMVKLEEDSPFRQALKDLGPREHAPLRVRHFDSPGPDIEDMILITNKWDGPPVELPWAVEEE
jgi:hypothetical protein